MHRKTAPAQANLNFHHAKRTECASTSATIADSVRKQDGSGPMLRAVDGVLAKKRQNPTWHGDDSCVGGRPRTLTRSQTEQLLNLVFRERGKARVTVKVLSSSPPFPEGSSRRHCPTSAPERRLCVPDAQKQNSCAQGMAHEAHGVLQADLAPASKSAMQK